MAEEKDTDSAPEDGVTESRAAESSPRHGPGPVSPAEPELDEQLEDDSDAEDDAELVGVGAATKSAAGRSGSPTAKASGRAKKDKPTPKQRTGEVKRKRNTPLEFCRQSISELKKVVWPTGSQLANYYVVVLIFVAVMIGIVMALDYGFGWLMLKVFS